VNTSRPGQLAADPLAALSVTSSGRTRATPPRLLISRASASILSARRADSTTSAPAAESTRAVALPIPLLAPVIQARLSCKVFIVSRSWSSWIRSPAQAGATSAIKWNQIPPLIAKATGLCELTIRSRDKLGLPPIIDELAHTPKGAEGLPTCWHKGIVVGPFRLRHAPRLTPHALSTTSVTRRSPPSMPLAELGINGLKSWGRD
jgi:hypothetical protein